MRLKFILTSLAIALGMSAQTKTYKYEIVPDDPMQTRVYTLANGLKVYLSVNKEKPRIQTYIAVRTGSRNDPAETTGLAHYLEHLMFKGTQQFGTTDYAAEKPFLDEIEARYEQYRKLTDPANRDLSSKFLNEVVSSKVDPIQPRFLDFKKDLNDTKTSKGLPLLYKRNTDDGLFNLTFYYDFGDEDNLPLAYAEQYLNYIGTSKKSAAEVKQAFYRLACNYGVSVGNNATYVTLNGLSENMPQALALLEELLQDAKADKESYSGYVDLVMKERNDTKKNQTANFRALCNYAVYGPYNPARNVLSEQQLREQDPQKLVDGLKTLRNMQQTVLYFGPMSEKELSEQLVKHHKTAKKLTPVPVGKEYTEQANPTENEILLAPYEAKNIYMRQYHNTDKQFSTDGLAVKSLFNEYFGGGMNTIVFQELREARGLAYNAYANYNAYPRVKHPETYFTHIISQNDKMIDCIRVFNSILDTIPQSEAAFNIAKQSLTKSLQSMRTTRENVLFNYLNLVKQRGLTEPTGLTIYKALPALQLSDIVKFEQQNMANKVYRFAILGDEKNIDVKGLEKIGKIKKLSTEEIFGY